MTKLFLYFSKLGRNPVSCS